MTAARDLFAPAALELPASHLRPGDTFRRGHRVMTARYVAVTHGAPVVVTCARVFNGRALDETEDLSLPPEELIRRLP